MQHGISSEEQKEGEHYEKIIEERKFPQSDERERVSNPNAQRRPPRGSWVYIVQARFDSSFEAESEMNSLVRTKPEMEEYTHQEREYIFVKCSTESKAETVKNMVKKHIDPIDVTIKKEIGRVEQKGKLGKIKDSFASFLPFVGGKRETQRKVRTQNSGQSQRKQLEQRQTQQTQSNQIQPQQRKQSKNNQTNQNQITMSEDTPQKEVIGTAIPTENFRHFIETEADPSDVESLMMTRQQIAKGEGLGGTDPKKWAVAAAIIIIVLGVFWVMIGGGGGGGGVSIPGMGSIP